MRVALACLPACCHVVRFDLLLARMSALENSVEAEHETSLDLLDVLLMKKQTQQPASSAHAHPAAEQHGASA